MDDVTLGDLIEGDSFLASSNTFTAEFSGFINIGTPGVYTFILAHDDGARLFIDNQLVIEFDRPTAIRRTSGTVEFLEAGLYPIQVEVFENGGDANIVLSYIPLAVLIA